jgi:mono/diheme cytochrome c family protein
MHMSKSVVFSIFALLMAYYSFGAPPAEDGKRIFSMRCAACHNVNKTLTGPALAGVQERRSTEWIISFVHSSQTLVRNGDKDAVALFEKFNKIAMPDHRDLSADDIKNILEYIKVATVATPATTAPFRKPDLPLRPKYTPVSLQDHTLLVGYFVAIALLVGALLALVKVKSLQRQQAAEYEQDVNT